MDKSIHHVFAENLEFWMAQKGLRQMPLAEKSKVAQTTISNYLHPDRRATGKSGKPASAKLTEIESLAKALGIPVWVLLRPRSAGNDAVFAEAQSRKAI